MGASATSATTWGVCRFCGTAVAPGATECGLCGEGRPIPAGGLSGAPRRVQRRVALMNWLRALIVVGVGVGLAYAMIDAVLTGPPNVPDPLTTSGTYTVGPGWEGFLYGEVTGGDYVVGNFSSIHPFDAEIAISAYNASQWKLLATTGTGTPAWSTPAEGSGRIVFTALYTDNYTFVLTNPYPVTTHLNITVYVSTTYESNVGDDGMA